MIVSNNIPEKRKEKLLTMYDVKKFQKFKKKIMTSTVYQLLRSYTQIYLSIQALRLILV